VFTAGFGTLPRQFDLRLGVSFTLCEFLHFVKTQKFENVEKTFEKSEKKTNMT